jgi:hypothetical protein
MDTLDFAPPIPIVAEMLGGQMLGAANAEEDASLPQEFKALTAVARQACRFRVQGMKVQQIAEIMQYHPGSISNMTRHTLAKEYMLWLQARMDDTIPDVQAGMHMLGTKALERVANIIVASKNEGLVAKCAFQLFDRIGLKPAERVILENNTAITSEDISRMQAESETLNRVLEQK